MLRWGCIASLVAGTGCSLATTQKIPLVMLTDVPVPAEARWAEGDEEEIGGDSGGGILFFNFQADPTDGLFEVLETDETQAAAEGELYYEGTETRTFLSLFVLFFEGVRFDARRVRLKKKPLPPEISDPVPAAAEPAPAAEPEAAEPAAEVEPKEEEEPAVDAGAEPPEESPAVEEAEETKAKKKGKKKRKRRKKRRKGGRK